MEEKIPVWRVRMLVNGFFFSGFSVSPRRATAAGGKLGRWMNSLEAVQVAWLLIELSPDWS